MRDWVFVLLVALIFALMAFGYYRAGAFFDRWYQWKTREEEPAHFWLRIVSFSGLSLMLVVLAVYWAVHGP